jgi:glycosyltransferase involved in cell wall biosynthesis
MASVLPAPFHNSPANRAALARAHEAIAAARAGFEALEAAALRARDPLEAAALARMAYTYGMFEHPGLLASGSLERLLHELGGTHVPGGAPAAVVRGERGRSPGEGGMALAADGVRSAAAGGGARERVLHVATVVSETGGHGRVLERWLARDAGRTPTVLLLKDDEPVPESLRRAVAAAGGRFAPSLPAADLFTKARALRALAAAHDLVVLHVSNHEVVVPLAFADPAGRPPTILCNHASHQLWTGVGCADVVANLNEFDAATTVARRGVGPQRSRVLRAPAAPRALPARADARRALGLDPDAPVVLTIASPYKLRAVLDPSWSDIAAAVLDAVPDATLLLVGPSPEEPVVLPGHPRVRALGRLADVGPQLAAADLLLDSWPVTGGTTALDAGAAGLPVLALGDPPPEMVGAPEDLLGGFVARAASVAELGERAGALLDDPGERARLAARARAVVAQRHGDGWVDQMEALVAAAREHHGAAAPPPAAAPFARASAPPVDTATVAPAPLAAPPADWEAVLQLVRDGHEQGCTPEQAYAWNVPELPPARRPRTGAEVIERVARMRFAAAVETA